MTDYEQQLVSTAIQIGEMYGDPVVATIMREPLFPSGKKWFAWRKLKNGSFFPLYVTAESLDDLRKKFG